MLEPRSGSTPRAHIFVLAALAAIFLLRIAYASTHMDLARDMFIAWRMVHGVEIPLSGPVLAATIHLGPIWYWLLALLLVLAGSWLGTLLLLGLLAATQFPLAYALGRELHSRTAGLMLAIGLAVPSWSSIEWTYPLHFLFTTPLILIFLLCAARYLRQGRLRHLVGMALSFVLALHAHPTTVGLALIGLGILPFAWRAGHFKVRDLLIAAVVGLLPLLPYFIWDGLHGFVDLRAGAGYLGDAEKTGSFASIPGLFEATAIGGTHYWFGTLLGWSAAMAAAATALLAAGGVLGAVGVFVAVRQRQTRGLALACIAGVVAILLTTVLIRKSAPYYMTTPLRVVMTVMVAAGLASLGAAAWARYTRAAIATLVAACLLVCSVASARMQTRGNWPFSFVPLFWVDEAAQPTQPLLLEPAYSMRASGEFLCSVPMPSVHGAYAMNELHDYAIDMRLVCGRNDVQLGGSDPTRQHWIGLSRAMFAKLGVRPQRRLGPLGVLPARPLTDAHALTPPDFPRYPVYLPKLAPVEEHRLRVKLAAGEHLAIANIPFSLAPDPELQVTINGKAVEAKAFDWVTHVYACDACAGADGADVELSIKSSDFADLDIVAF